MASSSVETATAFRAENALAEKRASRAKSPKPRPSMAAKHSIAQDAAEQVARMAGEPSTPPMTPQEAIGQAMHEVAAVVNAGALDSAGIRCTASVLNVGSYRVPTADQPAPEPSEDVADQAGHDGQAEDVLASETPASDRRHDGNDGRKLVRHGHPPDALPDDRFPVPSGVRFEMASETYGAKFLHAPELETLGAALIDHMPEFDHLADVDIVYRWKATGGAVDDAANYGDCQKLSGAIQHFAEAQFLVWLAADHCRVVGANRHQVEALVYHQLSHCLIDEKEQPKRGGHDYSGFSRELDRYGAYRDALRVAAKSFRQVTIWEFRDTLNERGALDLSKDSTNA